MQAAQQSILKKLGKMRQQSLAQGTAGHGTTGPSPPTYSGSIAHKKLGAVGHGTTVVLFFTEVTHRYENAPPPRTIEQAFSYERGTHVWQSKAVGGVVLSE